MKFVLTAAIAGMLLWASVASGQQIEEQSFGAVDLRETDDVDLGLWSREKLTGDWYGQRGELAASGLTVNFNATYVFQGSCPFSLRLVFVICGWSSRFREWTPVTTRKNGFDS